jgi:hypothetical protein
MAESPYIQLVPGVCRSKRLTINESDFIRSKERMVNTREEVEATPNELEVFREAREVRILVEHEASEDLDEDLAGTDVALQGVEATTSAQVRLGQPSGTHEILTQEGVDTGEQTEPMFHPDGVSHLVVPMHGPNLIFAKPHDHLDGNRVAANNETKHQETESVSEKLIRGGKGTPPELDTLPLSSDPAITKPNTNSPPTTTHASLSIVCKALTTTPVWFRLFLFLNTL